MKHRRVVIEYINDNIQRKIYDIIYIKDMN